ncbi:YdeI/OmpD-associated family protein [Streptomyces sp. 15-116A]|uniref:YdeI/OmpD-associated family protein n=1 Tax=Streptomyces sp. 15-116A TaxID=2259035 RepID=UPI0021B1F2B1|nr:YdeI/OmpD-associated family protein [Streptomyces sp. 15-116A]MCT7355619.1 YdeI/OmpD-associated family protein [Streptomyces sp. 15-116A]
MTPSDGIQPLAFESADGLDAWLSEHPAPHPGLWVKVAKKGTGIASLSAGDVNDVALCHGWITGQRKGLDDVCFLQRITPRRPGSLWSMVNVRRVEELIEQGRMRAGGFAEIDAAKADGRWEAAYASQKEAAVPEDLAAELERNPRARAAFDTLGRSGQYVAMLVVLRARTPRSRAARIRAVVEKLAAGRG